MIRRFLRVNRMLSIRWLLWVGVVVLGISDLPVYAQIALLTSGGFSGTETANINVKWVEGTEIATLIPTEVSLTPQNHVVIVTDYAASMVDISNATDWDYYSKRGFSIQWDLNLAGIDPADIVDVHIYVETDGSGVYEYLGRTASGTATSFEWKPRGLLTHPNFPMGPAYGSSYRFCIFALTKSGEPFYYGPFNNAGPVDYRRPVIVTDDPSSERDLGGTVDRDFENERGLTIRWYFDSEMVNLNDVKEYHVYVQVDGQSYKYLGTTRNASSNFLEWKPTTSTAFNPLFRTGPQYGSRYLFKVYALTKSKLPLFYGPFTVQDSVLFHIVDF